MNTVNCLTRRDCLRMAAGAGFGTMLLNGQEASATYSKRSTVSLIHGEDRRKIVYESLKAIEEKIAPGLRQRAGYWLPLAESGRPS